MTHNTQQFSVFPHTHSPHKEVAKVIFSAWIQIEHNFYSYIEILKYVFHIFTHVYIYLWGSLSCWNPDWSKHTITQHSLCYIFSKRYLYLETPRWAALSLLLFPHTHTLQLLSRLFTHLWQNALAVPGNSLYSYRWISVLLGYCDTPTITLQWRFCVRLSSKSSDWSLK